MTREVTIVESMPGERGPASLAQQGIWVTERTGAAGTAFHMPLVLRLDGELDTDALLAAWADTLARHPVLSSALREHDGTLQLVPAATPPPVERSGVPAPEGTMHAGQVEEEVERRVRAETLRGFDLESGPLARVTLLALAPERHVLLLVIHHAVFDGVSKDVLVRDLAAAYRARRDGGDADLPRLPASYAEHAAAERERVTARLAEAGVFWKARWRDPEPLVLPGQDEPPRVAAPGEEIVEEMRWEDVTAAARAVGLTPFELLLSALHALLYRYGNAEPVVAVDLSTRTPETGDHIGLFVNELPVFSSPAPGQPFAELARSVRAELREVYRFRSVPLARAVPGIRPRAAHAPVSLSYRGRDPERSSGRDSGYAFPGLDVTVDWATFNFAARSALHLQVVDSSDQVNVGLPNVSQPNVGQVNVGQIDVRLRFSPEVIGHDQVRRIAGHLRTLLREAAANPDTRLDDLCELEETDRRPEPSGGRGATPASTPAGSPTSTSGVSPATAEPGAADGITYGIVGEITEIWREVLQMDDVRADDDLFDLGGHSLTITQIIARVDERLGVEVSLEDFFESPTIAGMAAAITRTQQPADAYGPH